METNLSQMTITLMSCQMINFETAHKKDVGCSVHHSHLRYSPWAQKSYGSSSTTTLLHSDLRVSIHVVMPNVLLIVLSITISQEIRLNYIYSKFATKSENQWLIEVSGTMLGFISRWIEGWSSWLLIVEPTTFPSGLVLNLALIPLHISDTYRLISSFLARYIIGFTVELRQTTIPQTRSLYTHIDVLSTLIGLITLKYKATTHNEMNKTFRRQKTVDKMRIVTVVCRLFSEILPFFISQYTAITVEMKTAMTLNVVPKENKSG